MQQAHVDAIRQRLDRIELLLCENSAPYTDPPSAEWTDMTTTADAARGQRREVALQGVRSPQTRVHTLIGDPVAAYLKALADDARVYTQRNPDGTYTHTYVFAE